MWDRERSKNQALRFKGRPDKVARLMLMSY